jgi:hypothetical protein
VRLFPLGAASYIRSMSTEANEMHLGWRAYMDAVEAAQL